MNMYYLQQAETYAKNNPNDAYAQRLWVHWLLAVQQIEAQRRALATPAGPGAAAAPAPVPSNLFPSEAPTPPGTSANLSPHVGGHRTETQSGGSVH